MPNDSFKGYVTDWERLLADLDVREAERPAPGEGGVGAPGDYYEG